jgi:cytosine/adenosine deaminase-related metal-dependent hydrolase
MPVIYSARWVLPIVGSHINNGAVLIDDSTIAAVGARDEIVSQFPDSEVKDFGEAAILPGFVNAHSHLELTVMRGFLEAEEDDFFAWLRKLTVARMAMTDEDLIVSATCGAIEAARAGVTCLGDSSSFAVQAMQALKQVGLRGIVYQESFGPNPVQAEENVSILRGQLERMRAHEDDLVRAGVSPHAPYTVSPRQLEMISRLAIDEKLPLMMHAAESEAERLFMTKGTGAFAEGLQKRGIEWRAPGISTVQYLKQTGLLETAPLLAHCINVDDADLSAIKESGSGIAHCPKSNAKLGHGVAPFAGFLGSGLKVGLGSDSVASNNTCDILEEARFATLLARVSEDRSSGMAASDSRALLINRQVTASEALFAATLGGAQALRLDAKIGALAQGMQADLAIVSLGGAHQQPASNPVDSLIFSSSAADVVMTIVAGKEIYRNNSPAPETDQEFQMRAREIRTKLDSLS